MNNNPGQKQGDEQNQKFRENALFMLEDIQRTMHQLQVKIDTLKDMLAHALQQGPPGIGISGQQPNVQIQDRFQQHVGGFPQQGHFQGYPHHQHMYSPPVVAGEYFPAYPPTLFGQQQLMHQQQPPMQNGPMGFDGFPIPPQGHRARQDQGHQPLNTAPIALHDVVPPAANPITSVIQAEKHSIPQQTIQPTIPSPFTTSTFDWLNNDHPDTDDPTLNGLNGSILSKDSVDSWIYEKQRSVSGPQASGIDRDTSTVNYTPTPIGQYNQGSNNTTYQPPANTSLSASSKVVPFVPSARKQPTTSSSTSKIASEVSHNTTTPINTDGETRVRYGVDDSIVEFDQELITDAIQSGYTKTEVLQALEQLFKDRNNCDDLDTLIQKLVENTGKQPLETA
ncbi:MAG: hypothetical protein EZS28_009222 [Streblomastix strix]|uniref:Uncharacterized protein n=1 Tax=Streblomastix strix TaxID=222440 RepID=A0A5J4WLV3_9EUKA|nr:MAG: hypothetical protein EZS28_009222 [Streblomastix strix]